VGEERKRNDETRIQGKKEINRQQKKQGQRRMSRKKTREIKKTRKIRGKEIKERKKETNYLRCFPVPRLSLQRLVFSGT